MNLERPFPAESSIQSYLQPKLIPLLVLINQWGSQGHAAVMQTDCIVLILECLQLTFSKIHQKFTLQTLVSQVEKVMGKEKHEAYIKSLHTLANCVPEFMKLFKQLKTLIEAPKKEEADSTTPIIDSDNGVLGTFIKYCLQGFERLTFSQVVLFHTQWKQFMIESNNSEISLNIRKKSTKEHLSAAKRSKNTTLALRTLMISKSQDMTVELKALHLAMLMTQFNHIEESEFALKEAIRLAQLSENSLVLEHALALLQHCQPSCSTNSRSLVEQFIQNAKEQNQHLLVSAGKVQLARLDLSLNADPKHVLTTILSSQFDVLNSYDERIQKTAIHSTVLLLESNVYKQYNLSSLSYIPLQLLCHMMSHDRDRTPHHISDLAKAIQLLARSLNEEGQLEMAIKLVQCSLHHLEHVDKSNISNCDDCLKILLAELTAEKALCESNWLIVQENIDEMRVFDSSLAHYWSAKLLYTQTLYKSAMTVCNTLLKLLSTKPASIEIWTLETKVRLLQSDIFYAEGMNTLAINTLIGCITSCQKHHLYSLFVRTQLKLARSQIQLEILDQFTISELLPQLLSHGSSNDKAEAFLFLAQITILNSHKHTGYITNEAGYRALGLLSYAMAELHPISPPTHLMKHILILQAMLYHHVKDSVGVANSFQLLSH